MGHAVNVLISSVSKKVPLIRAVRKALAKMQNGGKVIGADADPHCIGKHFVDDFWQMPKLSDIKLASFLSECQRLGIGWIIPTRDGELEFYAEHKENLAKAGVAVMVSELSALSACLDKFRFYEKLRDKGFPAIPTSLSIEEVEGPLYAVKERFGAGSRGLALKLSKGEAQKHAAQLKNPIFQPFISGREVSVDLYLDRWKKTKGVIARKREVVVHGESQITTTFRDTFLERLCSEMGEMLQLSGHVMFQLIKDGDRYLVLECNPRIGGASTLSLEVGLDSFYWHFLEAQGKSLVDFPFNRSPTEKTLIRYPEDLIKDEAWTHEL